MNSRPSPRPVLLLLLLLLLALPVLAQDTGRAPEPALLTIQELPAIEAARDRAKTAQSQLAAGALAGAATTLELATPPAAAAVADWTKAVGERVAALDDLLLFATDRLKAKTDEDITRDLAEAAVQLNEAKEALGHSLTIDTSMTLADFRSAVDAAEQNVKDTENLLKYRQDRLDQLKVQAPGLADRIEALRKQLVGDEPGALDALGAYRQETLSVGLRALRERAASAPQALGLWSRLVELRKKQVEVARAGLTLAQRREEQARADTVIQARLRQQQAQGRAADAARAMEAASDKIVEFRQRRLRDTELAKVAAAKNQILSAELDPLIREQQSVNDGLEESWAALKERFDKEGGVSSRTSQILLANKKRVEQNRSTLAKRLMVDLEAKLSDALTDRANVQDQLLEIAPRIEEGPEEFLKLEKNLPDEDRERARQAWRESTDLYRTALRNEDVEIGTYLVVLARIYWIQDEDPLGLKTISGIRDEAEQLVLTYTGRPLLDGVAATYREGTWRFPLLAICFLLLVGLGIWIPRRVRTFRKRFSYAGGPLLVALQRIGMTVLISSLAPTVLALAALLLGVLNLPPELTSPGRALLFGFAIALFARRFFWNFFREEGIARKEFGAPEAVADQLWRASRWTAFGFVAFALPHWVLSSTQLTPPLYHLPRVCYTVMLAYFAFVLLALLRRRGPLMSAITGQTGFWFRLLFFLEPLLVLGFLGIVGMDVLGYRFGSALLTRNVLQTFLWGLLLIGFYNLLTTVVTHASTLVRQRKREELSAKEAWEQSKEVHEQLSRFAGVAMVVTAVMLMAHFWGALDGLESFFGAVALPKFAHVTLWDLLVSLLWIGAGHFVIRHLHVLFEVLVFPRLGKIDGGTRYVIVTVSKYLVFLFAYSSALLTLRFSFTSLGVVLAAVSLGIGFGLQEIVANFISGLILFFERPVRVGDIVSVGNTVGTVEQINIRATQVTNFDRQVMIIPNRRFIVDEVTNWTHNDMLVRGALEVGVAYGTDVEKVGRLLLELVISHPKVKRDPAPRFLFLNFGDSSLNLKVWFFTDIADRMPTISDLNLGVTRRFAEEGIEIPFPQRDIHVRSIQDDTLLAAIAARTPPGVPAARPKEPEPGPDEDGAPA